MYLMSTDTYVCDIFGFEGKFDTDNDIHGELWGANDVVIRFVQNVLLIS